MLFEMVVTNARKPAAGARAVSCLTRLRAMASQSGSNVPYGVQIAMTAPGRNRLLTNPLLRPKGLADRTDEDAALNGASAGAD